MKRKRHGAEEIIKKLRAAEAMLAADKTFGQLCQALWISEQTGSYYTLWNRLLYWM
jgi:putative transposase